MHIKTETAGSTAPELLDRRNAQARHDRWALEMDKALFSAVPPAGDPVRQPGQFAWQTASGSTTPARTHAEGGAARPTSSAAPEQAAIGHSESRERDDTVPHDGGVVTDLRRPAQPAGAEAEAPVSAAAAPSRPAVADRAAVPGMAAPAPRITAAAAPHVTDPALPPAAAVGAIAPGAASVQGFAQPLQTLAMGGAAAAAMRSETAPAMPAMLPPMPESGAGSFAARPERVAGMPGANLLEESTEAAAGARPPASAADEEYAQRVLHLYQQNGDVQAWIRDAQLQPSQAGALAQALAMQLSAQGTRLATLTINGREVELPTEDRPQPVNLFDEQLRRVEG